MKEYFKVIFTDTILTWAFWLTILFLIISTVVTVIIFPKLPPIIPLYNKMTWGYARLGSKYEIGFILLVPLLFFVMNIFLGKNMYAKVPLLARFLFLTSVALALFTSIFIVKMIFVVL